MSTVSEGSNQAALSLPVTAIIFAAISAVLYFFLLKPLLSPVDAPPTGAATDTPARVVANNNNTTPQRRARQRKQDSSDIATLLAENTRCPPHMAPASGARYLDTGGISLLSEGLLPFRHGRAAAYEQALAATNAEQVTKNRKDRARVLSRVLALDNGGPPSRGSTVVISIPVTENLSCEKLQRALYLLSTHFNTMLILSNVSSEISDSDVDAMVKTLRGTGNALPEDVLPRHRIVAAQSITGRVAFCRQLGRVEFVLDFDEEMKAQLGRFGFRVLVYGSSPVEGVSSLGYSLIA